MPLLSARGADNGRWRKERVCLIDLSLRVPTSINSRSRRRNSVADIVKAIVPPPSRSSQHHPRLTGLSVEAALDWPLSLADAQLVIAREYEFPDWTQLKHHVEAAARISGLEPFEQAAEDILLAYRSGDSGAVERVEAFVRRGVTVHDIRSGVQRRLQKDAGAEISPAEARDVVAGLRGFASWAEFVDNATRRGGRMRTWATPLYRFDEQRNRLEVSRPVDEDEWPVIIAAMKEKRIAALDANGQMTDAVISKVAELDHVTGLWLAQSRRLTDDGLRHLARLPYLRDLDLSRCGFTERGLEIFRELKELRTFHLHWHKGVSDAAFANLAFCDRLENVDLLGSSLGDGVLRALSGKGRLRHLKTGTEVTDAGLPLLHRLPVFKTWHGGAVRCSLMSFDAEPNHLLVDGPFTDEGIATLRGLEGVFGLSFFWHSHAFSADALTVLADLPNLAFLGCDGERCTDDAMRHIAGLPRLRMLLAQGTVAGDAGFSALSRSPSLEYVWGRECPNLSVRGFVALTSMPSLRGLAVSCRNVDDRSLSTLTRAAGLRELMPMDVSDAGFRHVGRCENLERLWCMYCRDTTDAATEHLGGLMRLRTYYAGQTKITNYSLELLSRLPSLEQIEFWNCAGISDRGAAALAALPRLREVSFENCLAHLRGGGGVVSGARSREVFGVSWLGAKPTKVAIAAAADMARKKRRSRCRRVLRTSRAVPTPGITMGSHLPAGWRPRAAICLALRTSMTDWM
jgi:hypothetical protein